MKHAFFILFVFYCVNLFSATKPYGLQESQEQLKKRFSDSKKYPDIITSEALQYYVIKSAYDNADEKFYRSYPTSSDRFRLGRKVQINIYYTQCEQNKNMRACENLKKEMDFIGQLRGYENFKPKIIDLPNVDVAAKTFTVANGETYSFETGELVSKSDKSKIEAVTSGQQNPKLKSEPTTKAGSEQPTTEKYTDEKSGNDDSEYTCEWSNGFSHGNPIKSTAVGV